MKKGIHLFGDRAIPSIRYTWHIAGAQPAFTGGKKGARGRGRGEEGRKKAKGKEASPATPTAHSFFEPTGMGVFHLQSPFLADSQISLHMDSI